ncbi:hypothetical protein L2E82_15929 [Cichorium intybus]|uniref:Uncharacterized protein n=1 Tax=Cichorium intybus TaxID=13427 RepID=A0ACB9F4Q4_CICIN|nr:hypothetical protein L2E82_15929 [Cichorium intybus]
MHHVYNISYVFICMEFVLSSFLKNSGFCVPELMVPNVERGQIIVICVNHSLFLCFISANMISTEHAVGVMRQVSKL